MVDYSFTQDILKGIGFLYIALTLLALGLAVWLPKRWWGKLIAVAVVVGVFSILPRKAQQEVAQQQVKVDEFKQRYQVAKALFDERCKTAGEKIYKTVDNVEGVLLLNVRERRPNTGQYEKTSDPNWPDAAAPYESAEEFVGTFLSFEYKPGNSDPNWKMPSDERGQLNIYRSPTGVIMSTGYRFVDVRQADGTVLRYKRTEEERSKLIEVPLVGQPARYAIAIENDVDPNLRKHWIAGTKVTITDTKTGELLAEQKYFAFHSDLGSRSGGQQPWLFATNCPELNRVVAASIHPAPTRLFADQILKPIQEKK